jgi:hypothetical protein
VVFERRSVGANRDDLAPAKAEAGAEHERGDYECGCHRVSPYRIVIHDDNIGNIY